MRDWLERAGILLGFVSVVLISPDAFGKPRIISLGECVHALATRAEALILRVGIYVLKSLVLFAVALAIGTAESFSQGVPPWASQRDVREFVRWSVIFGLAVPGVLLAAAVVLAIGFLLLGGMSRLLSIATSAPPALVRTGGAVAFAGMAATLVATFLGGH